MKRILQVIICLVFSTSFCYAQTGETFTVKKKATETKKAVSKMIDLNIGPYGDTICNSVLLNLTPAQGLYDSISLLNLKLVYTTGINTHYYGITSNQGHAIITFYKKEPNGSYSMVYFRNWVIKCKTGQRQ